jgi:hypothetical protein
MISASSIYDTVEMPAAYTFELPLAAVGEDDSGPGDEILDGARYEHFARLGRRCDTGARVHGDPADLVAHQLTLAGVKPGPDLDP